VRRLIAKPRGMAENRHAKNNHGRKQCRTPGEPSKPSIRLKAWYSNDPQDREWEPRYPAEMRGPNNTGRSRILRPPTKSYRRSNAFNSELKVRDRRVNVVIDTEQETIVAV